VFLGGVLGIAAAYAIGAVYVGLGTQIGKALLHSANSLVDGAVIALSAAAIGIAAILSRPVPSLGKIIARGGRDPAGHARTRPRRPVPRTGAVHHLGNRLVEPPTAYCSPQAPP
jgi:hypothetical protein